ncbi:alpha-adducin-like isoform X1 [Brachionus plicatilis]|uniref:Alpha-adducin-like isoform X1 n=1 Tax=Brachionus plicatilis TaxID=10195 RepID=A0A3M7SNJ0_BRAPC|nr:alpha-adducin-like isoform X1 [Brachionus plicatilis]
MINLIIWILKISYRMIKYTRIQRLVLGLFSKPIEWTRSFSSEISINKINDIKTKGQNLSNHEERCKLASVYRLVDLKNWSWSIYNHITLRCNDHPEHFLINPFGLFYSEITASKLLKINSSCNILERGTTTYGLNKAGFTLHSTIHNARTDINAVIHVHTGLAASLSTLKCGLLPISQEALICGNVSYHDYEGILIDDAVRQNITNDLGPENKIMILRNHGVVFCGNTIEEAWFYLMTFMTAADIQFHALSAASGIKNLIIPPSDILDQVQKVVKNNLANEQPLDGIQWKLGELEFEAEMRRLDLMGYETGYPYKKSLIN